MNQNTVRYVAGRTGGGSWAVWGADPDLPYCRVTTGDVGHPYETARKIAEHIAAALNHYESALSFLIR